MDLFEYQARDLFAEHGVPVLDAAVADTPEAARAGAEQIGGGTVVVKAQVKTGGRGKAGGVKLADTADEAEALAGRILGMDIKGHTVHRVLVEEGSAIAQEFYFSFLLDRANRTFLSICSVEGGVEIEEVPHDRLAMVPISPLTGVDRAKARETATELLKLVGLAGFENKYPSELSGGMQQRAALVRGLIHDPSILLMDEPFGALDALTRERMNVELQRIWLARKKTVFLITHSIPEAVFLSDRVLVMSARPGRIVREFEIPFPRPRSIDITGTSEFGAYAKEIRDILDQHEEQAS